MEFKPFDKIIIKSKSKNHAISNVWGCAEFSHYYGDYIVFAGGHAYNIDTFDILPFEGNQYLVGTSDVPEEEVVLKQGDIVIVFDDFDSFYFNGRFDGTLSTFNHCSKTDIITSDNTPWRYCIPFSKFNPKDMEETKKHILCVENNRLIRAKL